MHLINSWDKLASYRHAVRLTGSGYCRHILLVLGLKGGVDVSAPVLENNLSRVMRNDEIFHFCGHEDADDNNSELVSLGFWGGGFGEDGGRELEGGWVGESWGWWLKGRARVWGLGGGWNW